MPETPEIINLFRIDKREEIIMLHRLSNKPYMVTIREITRGLGTIMSTTITTEGGPSTKMHLQKKMRIKI